MNAMIVTPTINYRACSKSGGAMGWLHQNHSSSELTELVDALRRRYAAVTEPSNIDLQDTSIILSKHKRVTLHTA